jgi:integrase
VFPVPRSSTLKPTQIQSRKDQGVSSWCLNVPPELSETGKRQRFFYETKTEASTACDIIKTRKANFGVSLASLSPTRIAEASEAYNILDGVNVSLLTVVRKFMQEQKARTASVTFVALFDQYIVAKSDKSPKYLVELKNARNRFPSLHDRIVSDIVPADIEPLLAGITAGGRNAVMRYLRAVFFYGVKKGYLTENPILRLDFANRKRKEIATIPAVQVEAMLIHALDHDLALLPYLVFGFFAGIRPDGELHKLEWRDVKFSENTIVIRPEISKTNRRRFPKISANAAAWIEAYRQRGGTFDGKVSPYRLRQLRRHRENNWKAAGIDVWVLQGMRHTFCSNWLALNKDINELVLQSGHDNVDTMWRNYHKGVTEIEAKTFWNIMPPSEKPNVVAFQA